MPPERSTTVVRPILSLNFRAFPDPRRTPEPERGGSVPILTEPDNALTKQYVALIGTEGLTIDFSEDGLREMRERPLR